MALGVLGQIPLYLYEENVADIRGVALKCDGHEKGMDGVDTYWIERSY